MNATKKVRLTLEIEVSIPPTEDHERAVWTAAVAVTPTLPGVAFGPATIAGVEAEDELLAAGGHEAIQFPEPHATEGTTAAAPSIPGDIRSPVARGEATVKVHTVELTLPIVRQFGIAFGLWAYSTDIALTGHGQGKKPDLIAVEESDPYAAVVEAIDEQAPPRGVKREVAGHQVWIEEETSELYTVLREAMFEAYRWAPYMPTVKRYGLDCLEAPNRADPSRQFSADLSLDNPDLFSSRSSASLTDILVNAGIICEDQVPPGAAGGGVQFAFASEAEASAFLKRLNCWLLDYAVAVARRRWATAEAAGTRKRWP
jgi:hypothetical protein